ncbi:Vacuolar calcium ion transporter [Leucoagaricus sp. SymC.cos]|nr:Vacuolar calcium ion transporter [Leucoagaricus sp. SymC.cos]
MSASAQSLDGKTEVEHPTQGDAQLDQNRVVPEDAETPIGSSNGASIVKQKKATVMTEPMPSQAGTVVRTVSSRGGVEGRDERKTPFSMARLLRSASTMLIPEKKIGEAPDVRQSLWAVARCSYLNILLLFIPVAWALHFALPRDQSNRDTLIFVFSFLAIIPLAKLLGFATEELSLRVGQTLAGLLNATLGNAVELIVAIIALVKCELRIVQSSLVGSVLSNLLLVLGMCFFAGGLKYQEQGFGASATQLNSSLLTISVIAVLLPAAFHFSAGANLDDSVERRDILAVSRGTAIILLVIYIGYLLFQLWSHAQIFQDDSPDVVQSTEFAYTKKRREEKEKKVAEKRAANDHVGHDGTETSEDEEACSTASEEEEPQMNIYVTVGLLVVVTALVAVTAEFLLDAIQGMTSRPGTVITQEFVGMVLLPIVGNAAEHATAVTVSVKDKLNLSLSVAAGSSLQIALFVIPLIVTLGWILDKPMTLLFDPYESIVLFFSVLIVNYVTQDGKSNWLEGFLLMMLYVILAVTFWYYPASITSSVEEPNLQVPSLASSKSRASDMTSRQEMSEPPTRSRSPMRISPASQQTSKLSPSPAKADSATEESSADEGETSNSLVQAQSQRDDKVMPRLSVSPKAIIGSSKTRSRSPLVQSSRAASARAKTPEQVAEQVDDITDDSSPIKPPPKKARATQGSSSEDDSESERRARVAQLKANSAGSAMAGAARRGVRQPIKRGGKRF